MENTRVNSIAIHLLLNGNQMSSPRPSFLNGGKLAFLLVAVIVQNGMAQTQTYTDPLAIRQTQPVIKTNNKRNTDRPFGASHCAIESETPNDLRYDGAKKWKSGKHTIAVDGLARTFLLDLPDSLPPNAPLVLVFHGLTSTAEEIRNFSGFTEVAEQNGFAVVYPQGSKDEQGKTFFNVGYAFHAKSQVDDVRFTKAIVDQLVDDLQLDPHVIFSTGMSNGGDMSFYLAAQPEPFVKAIAPIAGTMMASWSKDFTPSSRTSMMAVHGTKDDITLWKGDLENRDGWGAYLGIESVIELWSKGLALEKEDISERRESAPPRNSKVIVKRWYTQVDSAEVRFYQLIGGGHDWPKHLGNSQQSTAAEVWEFFAKHRDN